MGEEKKFAFAKEILAIEHEGLISNDKAVIQYTFLRYYQRLFGGDKKTKSQAALDYLPRNAPKLSQEEKEWLEGPITEGEVKRAIDILPMHKTPGPDGLSGEF